MNKIRFAVHPDINYIFHMLSVARCGYDNAYGAKYRHLYRPEDLATFKAHEDLLTVRGGEHCGALYHLMVCRPAWGEITAKAYFLDLPQRILWEDIRDIYAPYAEIIRELSEVMVRHYDYYMEDIWPEERRAILSHIPELEAFFENTRFTEQAEALVGCPLESQWFTATLVSSVEGGAEAIDISREQDLFGIGRSATDAGFFIGHEFIVYLLFHAFSKENAFQSFETWAITEGLAEYYLKQILGSTRFFQGQQRYVELFEQWGPLSAAELYRRAAALLPEKQG